MPILPRLSPRRLYTASVLLAVVVLVAVLVQTAPGPLDVARAKYDRIEPEMSLKEVHGILRGWWCCSTEKKGWGFTSEWLDYNRSVATIWIYFDPLGCVTEKRFDAGDQSRPAQVRRFKDRLANTLHFG